MRCSFLFFLIAFAVSLNPVSAFAKNEIICTTAYVKVPPLLVVPTGFDSNTNKDALERKKENQYANYYKGKERNPENGQNTGRSLFIPKRSIVKVDAEYRKLIEGEGEFAKYKNSDWVPVQVLSIPPENKGLQKSLYGRFKSIAKDQFGKNSAQAEPGSLGFISLSHLEKVDHQKDYIFAVKEDSVLFTALNDHLKNKGYKSLVPLAVRLRQNAKGEFEVNRCCNLDINPKDPNACEDRPIFQLLNITKSSGGKAPTVVFGGDDCIACSLNIFSSLTPLEEKTYSSIQSILSHPTLGLENSSEYKTISELNELNFVDSRGLVQLPVAGNAPDKSGPFNSLHYGPTSGDADVYMKPDVACGFIQFLKSWDQSCKGRSVCQIEFGDASHAYYKQKNDPKKDGTGPWVHLEHTEGECIDINTSRMGKNYLAPMMKMLEKLGQDKNHCFSMSPEILKGKQCTFDKTETHKTHMHICFPSNIGNSLNSNKKDNLRIQENSGSAFNPQLKKACESGVPKLSNSEFP
jgi:hypothetical protein